MNQTKVVRNNIRSESEGDARYKKRKSSLPLTDISVSEVTPRANYYKRKTMAFDMVASPSLNRRSAASVSLSSITGFYNQAQNSGNKTIDQDSCLSDEESADNSNEGKLNIFYWCYFIIIVCVGIAFPVATTMHSGGSPDSSNYSIYFRLFHDITSLCGLIILLLIIIRNVPRGHIIFTTNRLSFYMRIGILALSVGILMFQFMKLVEPMEAYILKVEFNVKGYNYFHSCCMVITVILETFIAFKYHQIAIKININLVKACLIQLISKNLIDTFQACIYEAYYNFFYCINKHQCNEKYFNSITIKKNPPPQGNETSRLRNSTKKLGKSVSTVTRDYLASFHVEYGVLMAAVFLQLYVRCSWLINKSIQNCREENQIELNRLSSSVQVKQQVSKCHKANLGIFMGIVMLAISIFTMVLFFLPVVDSEYIRLFIYSWHTVEVMIGIFLGSLLIYKFRFKSCKKSYNYSDSDTFISSMILKFSTWAYAFQIILMMIGLAGQINTKTTIDYYIIHTHSLLDLVQVCIQYVLILDTLNFRIVLQENAKDEKPGRRSLALLIFFNLIVWLFQHILGERNLRKHPSHEYYGDLTWGLICSLLFPFSLLNRFIGCVSLAIIWNRMYGASK